MKHEISHDEFDDKLNYFSNLISKVLYSDAHDFLMQLPEQERRRIILLSAGKEPLLVFAFCNFNADMNTWCDSKTKAFYKKMGYYVAKEYAAAVSAKPRLHFQHLLKVLSLDPEDREALELIVNREYANFTDEIMMRLWAQKLLKIDPENKEALFLLQNSK